MEAGVNLLRVQYGEALRMQVTSGARGRSPTRRAVTIPGDDPGVLESCPADLGVDVSRSAGLVTARRPIGPIARLMRCEPGGVLGVDRVAHRTGGDRVGATGSPYCAGHMGSAVCVVTGRLI